MVSLAETLGKDACVCEVRHVPVIRAYAEAIDLVGTINRLVPSDARVDPGTMTLAMVEDILCGRHPLYRIRSSFFEKTDVELALGKPVDLDYLSDDNFGRHLDRLYQAGTSSLLSALSFNAFRAFGVPNRHVHFDTTSVSLYGAYEPCEDSEEPPPFRITEGYSKDHRPDLKQFVVSHLCAGGTIPLFAKVEDGNASDKTLNNAVLSTLSQKLAAVGIEPQGSIYIGDAAMVTKANLNTIGEATLFITRLPATYAEHDRAIREAVGKKAWDDYGRLALTPAPSTRPPAHYRGYETTVTLYARSYRAIVVHSSSHDKRRQKRIERELAQERNTLTKRLDKLPKQLFSCRPDARAAADQLLGEARLFHDLDLSIQESPRYGPGRPRADGTQTLRQMRYVISGGLRERADALATAREHAGCFVLLSNVPPEGPPGAQTPYDGKALLLAYKDQHGIERNFGFLKDPAIVNAIFLKRPERIEALGLLLVVALLLSRLIESQMRRHLTQTQTLLPGWDDKPTARPTSFMMTTKFETISIVKIGEQRFLARPLSEAQHAFLTALGLSASIFIQPRSPALFPGGP